MGSVNAPATGKEITVKRVSKERKDFLSGYFLFQPPPPPNTFRALAFRQSEFAMTKG